MATSFTPYQKQAIETDGSDICVAAGAGSGKTGVLVERFVRILTGSLTQQLPPEQRADVENILVITFTEKATREMKSRIVRELERRHLSEERRRLETAYISTIHGFCSRLLQENPFEAGVDPQFRVMEEPAARRLLRQTFEEVIAEAYAEEDREIIELIAALQGRREYGEESGETLQVLAGAVDRNLSKLRGAGKDQEELARHWEQGVEATSAHSLGPIGRILAPVVQEIKATAVALETLKQGFTGALLASCNGLIERAEKLAVPEQKLPDLLSLIEEIAGLLNFPQGNPSGGDRRRAEILLLLQKTKTICENTRHLFGIIADQQERSGLHCHRLLGLIARVWKSYQEAKAQRGLLDSEDLQMEAVRLLETAPSVRRRYQRQFRHLLVDEFQDTNPLQMRLLSLLHRTEDDLIERRNYLFVVGDVQQSIYAFRNAEPTLFRKLERQYRAEGKGTHVPLSVNFRSRPEILRLIEQVYTQVWRGEKTPFVPLSPGATFTTKTTPSVEALLTNDLMRRDYVPLEAEALAGRIQQMVGGRELQITSQSDLRCGEPVSYRDIAILLRSLTDIQKYEEAFARRGIPYFVVGGGRGYYARREIRDLVNVLTVLETPLDDTALAAVLRSPFVGAKTYTLVWLSHHAKREESAGRESLEKTGRNKGKQTREQRQAMGSLYPALLSLVEGHELPEDEEKKLCGFLAVMEALRSQEDRLPVGHLLERLIAQTHYDARLLCRPGGRRRLANVRKLLQMANADSVMGVREFIRRLRDLEKLTDREGDAPTEEEAADVVRFFTIHGAKGLEFPVVILADLSRGLLVPEKSLFVCEPGSLAFGSKVEGSPDLVYRAIKKRNEEREKREAERVLYVAMTRAREHLILCGNIGRNKSHNWADNLFQTLGLLEAPPEPQTQILAGGIAAQVSSLRYYLPPNQPDTTEN